MATKLGALWLKTSKTGQAFFSGTITINGVEKKIVCFKNTYKEDGDSKPDWVINLSEPMTYDNPRKIINPKAKMPIDDDDEGNIPF